MATKYKATGCTKFLLVLLILVPLSYFGARIITGEDPLANVYPLFSDKKENIPAEEEIAADKTPAAWQGEEGEVSARIQRLENEVEKLKEELRRCLEKEEVKKQD